MQEGYREDFMQKTFEKVLIRDRVTNLRRYSANLNDFNRFKSYAKKFKPPEFKNAGVEKNIDMGLITR